MVAAPSGPGRYRLLPRAVLPAAARASVCDLGLLLGLVLARRTRRLKSMDADHLPAEIHHAGDLRPSSAAGCRRISALDPRCKDRGMATAAVIDAGTDGGRCLRNGLAFFLWRSCSVRSLLAFRSHSL